MQTLTAELNKEAIEAKINAPKKEHTCYFERAKLKKAAQKLQNKSQKNKEKNRNNDKSL